jgi:Sulfotransferase domain
MNSGARCAAEVSGLRLPDFIGVGPPRTATTWLHEALKGRVGLPESTKETDFFLWQYDKGLVWYASLFRKCAAGVPIGEFSPNYFVSLEARERIAVDIPDCKIIITLRDPVERLYSHYRKGYEQAYFLGTFEETLENRPDLLEWSRYAEHVRRWFDSFGRENVLVLIMDELKRNAQEFLDRVTRFIGVEPISLATVRPDSDLNAVVQMPRSLILAWLARNVKDRLERRGAFAIIRTLDRAGLRRILFSGGQQFPPLCAETKASLRREFEPEIQELEQLLRCSLPQWRGEVHRGRTRVELKRHAFSSMR